MSRQPTKTMRLSSTTSPRGRTTARTAERRVHTTRAPPARKARAWAAAVIRPILHARPPSEPKGDAEGCYSSSSAGWAVSSTSSPLRTTRMVTWRPMTSLIIRRWRSPACSTGEPSTSRMRSSWRSPARAAGLPATTSTTSTPTLRPALSAAAGGVAGGDGLEIGPLGPDDGEVGQVVAAHDLDVELAAVGEGGHAALGAVDHVGRREQEPIGGDGDGRTRALGPAPVAQAPA